MHYIKGYLKGVLKSDIIYAESSGTNLLYQCCSKPIDSPERLSSKRYWRYFTLADCLISVPLHTMCLRLVPKKTDFVVLTKMYTQ